MTLMNNKVDLVVGSQAAGTPPKDYLKSMLDNEETGIIATINRDGSPHIAPLWNVTVGDRIYIGTDTDTAKFRNLQRSGRLALCLGGRTTHMPTYVAFGFVRWCSADQSDDICRAYRKKYGDLLVDRFWNDKTRVCEVVPAREVGWQLRSRHAHQD